MLILVKLSYECLSIRVYIIISRVDQFALVI